MKFSVRPVLSAAMLLCAEAVALPQSPRQKPQLEEIASGKTRVIDLSYALSDKLVPWPGDAKAFEAKVNATVEKNGYFTRSFWMLEHYGTHMDAPAHFPPGTTTVDKIPVEKFFAPAVIVDVRNEAERNPDYQLTVKRIAAWEEKHGTIPEGCNVVWRTGRAARVRVFGLVGEKYSDELATDRFSLSPSPTAERARHAGPLREKSSLIST